MPYAVVLSRIRPELPRDEGVMPETVICRCEFDERDTAFRAARSWASGAPVRAGRERVRVLAVGSAQSRQELDAR